MKTGGNYPEEAIRGLQTADRNKVRPLSYGTPSVTGD